MASLQKTYDKLIKEKVVTFSRPYLSQLVAEGKIPYTPKGKRKNFEYGLVIKALSEMEQQTNDNKPSKDKFNLTNKDGSAKTINSTKIMLQEYQGKIAKQKFDVEAGVLVYREDVENKAFEVARVLRNQILAIPERLAGQVASTTDVNEVKEILYTELNEVLAYLSSEKDLYD